MRPENATTGLRPNVLNNKLNQTTSGFSRFKVFSSRKRLPGSSNDQQRRTVKPSGSTWFAESSSAKTVRLRKGLLFSSCAR